MKKIICILMSLFCISLVATLTMDDTTFLATSSNYTIYINESVTLAEIEIEANSIEFINISSGGTFINNNATYSSVISFYGLNSSGSIDSLVWDNGTIIGSTPSMDDINVTIPATRYIVLNTTTGVVVGVETSNKQKITPIKEEEYYNISLKLEQIDDWYFDEINYLRVYSYNDTYSANIGGVVFKYYNISGVYINQLDFRKKEAGVYEQEIQVYKTDDNITDKWIDVEASLVIDNEIISDNIRILVTTPGVIDIIYIKVKKMFSEDYNYVLYIVIAMLLFILLVMLFVAYKSTKKGKQSIHPSSS